MARKSAVDYDKVMQRQRNLIYETRNRLLDGEELQMDKILKMAEGNISRFLKSEEFADRQSVNRYILDNISYHLEDNDGGAGFLVEDYETVKCYLIERVKQRLEEQEKKLGSGRSMNDFMRVAVLSAIDEAWVEQVDYMQQLQAAVSGRATAQRNLLLNIRTRRLNLMTRCRLLFTETR